ncbi:hypothetical protein HOD05_03495 [Candidatus Woesearchaeota archaeon]|jgi:hypothetical protein|nr:hypothetical protein [Candidatus Woesearchaeota archaeon]MBT4150617.1 hypothetical protein [Candidatus Woesearchaeota archaeon]MBT4247835.1 hypothetical protein [Candidatus Woesearchaeota archaeon]MBT4434259.1 hypothetical protein [Candidatus Woesearchaeota archaeon]MBT7331820.1 hypothetical protein [Candidatus Woesearchaeota archaeon]
MSKPIIPRIKRGGDIKDLLESSSFKQPTKVVLQGLHALLIGGGSREATFLVRCEDGDAAKGYIKLDDYVPRGSKVLVKNYTFITRPGSTYDLKLCEYGL